MRECVRECECVSVWLCVLGVKSRSIVEYGMAFGRRLQCLQVVCVCVCVYIGYHLTLQTSFMRAPGVKTKSAMVKTERVREGE